MHIQLGRLFDLHTCEQIIMAVLGTGYYKAVLLLERLRTTKSGRNPAVQETLKEAPPMILEKAQAMGKA
jgi:hypothetical protein